MSRLRQFKLPDLGEGLTEGEILRWLVQPGDEVKLNQPIVEVETAKAAVEVPSPYSGVVTDLHHGEGETVDVGTPIMTFDTEPGAGPLPQSPAAESAAAGAAANPRESVATVAAESNVGSPREDEPVEPGMIGGPAPGGRTAVLVGYGPKSVVAKRRARKPGVSPAHGARPSAPAPSADLGEIAPSGVAEAAITPRSAQAGAAVLAKPPVRKLARDLGVDLARVTGSGPDGVITRDDVQAAVNGHAAAPAGEGTSAPAGEGPAPVATPSYAGPLEERIPVKGVRRLTAQNMVASAFTAPHVTEFVTVDVTPMVMLRERLGSSREFAGVKLTPLAFVAKALLLAVRRHPMVNSSWDDAAQEIVVKHYVNLGIAAATPRGLIVPNIKDAGRFSLRELAEELARLTAVARDGKTAPGDMQGGTMSITNVGVFGVDTGTPILPPGEAAILCLGAIRPTPWVYDGAITIRQVTQLGLSFDHRIVDGQLGSQFLADVARLLAEPETALAWA